MMAPAAESPVVGKAVISQRVPTRAELSVEELTSTFAMGGVVLPFDEGRVDFLSELSLKLSRSGRNRPEIQALAFWLRRGELLQLRERFAATDRASTLRVPRGTVFHIPPANVDTMFVYSWALSVLMGNRNLIRLSSRSNEHVELVISMINETLSSYPGVAKSTSMFNYEHDDRTTAALSLASDVRVIWGGDNTVNHVRALPLRPSATEVTFPNRTSMAAVSLAAYASLADAERDGLVERFFNDAYWFDQQGCSSPRLLIWVGVDPDHALARDFQLRLARIAAKKEYAAPASAVIAKRANAYRAMIDQPVEAYAEHSNDLTVVTVGDFPDLEAEFSGGGFFYETFVDSVDEVSQHVGQVDQTLAVFGLPKAELHELARTIAGRGIDRIVPIGSALNFAAVWDGKDLLAEFSKLVTIDAGE